MAYYSNYGSKDFMKTYSFFIKATKIFMKTTWLDVKIQVVEVAF